MFEQIMLAVIAIFLIEELIRYKVNIWELFMEEKGGKISSKRVGMMICLLILVQMSKDLMAAEKIERLDIVLYTITGALAFSPELLKSIVGKITSTYKKQQNGD